MRFPYSCGNYAIIKRCRIPGRGEWEEEGEGAGMGKTDKTAGQVPRRSIVLKISIFIALAFVVILGLLVGYFAYSIRTASQNIQEQQLRVMRVHTADLRRRG